MKFCFVTDEESFEDADGEEGEYHLSGDAPIPLHGKGSLPWMFQLCKVDG